MADKHHLNNEDFFLRLVELLGAVQTKGHGSVFLTQKRLTHSLASSSSSPATKAAADDTLADLHPPAPLPLLVRATDGKSKEHRKQKVKLSTVVQPTDIDTFFTRYAEVCKGGMTALRKRDRSGRKKAKAKKKKTTTTTTTTSATAAASGAATTAGSTGGVAGGNVRRKGER